MNYQEKFQAVTDACIEFSELLRKFNYDWELKEHQTLKQGPAFVLEKIKDYQKEMYAKRENVYKTAIELIPFVAECCEQWKNNNEGYNNLADYLDVKFLPIKESKEKKINGRFKVLDTIGNLGLFSFGASVVATMITKNPIFLQPGALALAGGVPSKLVAASAIDDLQHDIRIIKMLLHQNNEFKEFEDKLEKKLQETAKLYDGLEAKSIDQLSEELIEIDKNLVPRKPNGEVDKEGEIDYDLLDRRVNTADSIHCLKRNNVEAEQAEIKNSQNEYDKTKAAYKKDSEYYAM